MNEYSAYVCVATCGGAGANRLVQLDPTPILKPLPPGFFVISDSKADQETSIYVEDVAGGGIIGSGIIGKVENRTAYGNDWNFLKSS